MPIEKIFILKDLNSKEIELKATFQETTITREKSLKRAIESSPDTFVNLILTNISNVIDGIGFSMPGGDPMGSDIDFIVNIDEETRKQLLELKDIITSSN